MIISLINKILVSIISFICGLIAVISSLIISEGIGFEPGSFYFISSVCFFTVILFISQFICIGIVFSMIPYLSFFDDKKTSGGILNFESDNKTLERLKKSIKIK